MAKKILIVDDEVDVVKALKKILELGKYEVIVAYNGEECIGKIVAYRPDMVLLDVRMTGMSGIEVVQRIRKLDAIRQYAASLPIIVITAYPFPEVKELLRQGDIRRLLIKPVMPQELLEIIGGILSEGE